MSVCKVVSIKAACILCLVMISKYSQLISYQTPHCFSVGHDYNKSGNLCMTWNAQFISWDTRTSVLQIIQNETYLTRSQNGETWLLYRAIALKFDGCRGSISEWYTNFNTSSHGFETSRHPAINHLSLVGLNSDSHCLRTRLRNSVPYLNVFRESDIPTCCSETCL